VKWWLAAAGFAAALWWSCTRPITMPSDLPDHTDKLVHAASWAVLTLLLAQGGVRRGWPRLVVIGGAALLALGYGGLVEWAQSHVPGRDASLADLVADAIGAVAGAAAALYGSRRHADRP